MEDRKAEVVACGAHIGVQTDSIDDVVAADDSSSLAGAAAGACASNRSRRHWADSLVLEFEAVEQPERAVGAAVGAGAGEAGAQAPAWRKLSIVGAAAWSRVGVVKHARVLQVGLPPSVWSAVQELTVVVVVVEIVARCS